MTEVLRSNGDDLSDTGKRISSATVQFVLEEDVVFDGPKTIDISIQERRDYGGATLTYHFDSSGEDGHYTWSGEITGSGTDTNTYFPGQGAEIVTDDHSYDYTIEYDSSGNAVVENEVEGFYRSSSCGWSEPVFYGETVNYEGFLANTVACGGVSGLDGNSFSGDSSFGSITDTEINVDFAPSDIPGMPSGPGVPEALTGLNFSPPSLTDVVCLPAWQRINLVDGIAKTIPELNVGDYVEVPDEDDPEGPKKRCRVVEIYHNDPQPILTLKFRTSNGEEFAVSSTPGHRYYVRNIGWQHASDMDVGSECRTGDDDWAVLLSSELDPNPVPVYNFQVEGAHTYFVGDSAKCSVLTHNQDCKYDRAVDELKKLVPRRLEDLSNDEILRRYHGPNIINGKRAIGPMTPADQEAVANLLRKHPEIFRENCMPLDLDNPNWQGKALSLVKAYCNTNAKPRASGVERTVMLYENMAILLLEAGFSYDQVTGILESDGTIRKHLQFARRSVHNIVDNAMLFHKHLNDLRRANEEVAGSLYDFLRSASQRRAEIIEELNRINQRDVINRVSTKDLSRRIHEVNQRYRVQPPNNNTIFTPQGSNIRRPHRVQAR